VKAEATSRIVNIADDSVALAMKHIFSQLEISQLDIADGLKELLSDAASVSGRLGIDEYVAKMTIDAAKRKAIE
jgi:hypothetical protein